MDHYYNVEVNTFNVHVWFNIDLPQSQVIEEKKIDTQENEASKEGILNLFIIKKRSIHVNQETFPINNNNIR